MRELAGPWRSRFMGSLSFVAAKTKPRHQGEVKQCLANGLQHRVGVPDVDFPAATGPLIWRISVPVSQYAQSLVILPPSISWIAHPGRSKPRLVGDSACSMLLVPRKRNSPRCVPRMRNCSTTRSADEMTLRISNAKSGKATNHKRHASAETSAPWVEDPPSSQMKSSARTARTAAGSCALIASIQFRLIVSFTNFSMVERSNPAGGGGGQRHRPG